MTSQAKIVVTAEDRASKVMAQVREQLDRTSGVAERLAASAGLIGPAFGALSAAGIMAFALGVSQSVDALNDVADATGASVEGLSALERVARQNGGTLDDVAAVLTKLNMALNEAGDPKSDAAQMFAALGLSVKDLKAADPTDMLQSVARALAGFADNGNKGRFYLELTGRAAKDAAPLLKDLAEAGQLNATVTAEQAAHAEAFNKELAALRANADDAARALLDRLLPAVNQAFADARSGGLVKMLGLEGFFGQIGQAGNALQLLGLARERITPLSILEKDPTNARALAELARIDGEAKAIGASFKAAREQYLGLTSQAGAGRGFVNPPVVKPSLPDIAKPSNAAAAKQAINENAQALARYVDQLQQQLDKTRDLAEVEKARDLLKSLGVTGEVAQVQQLVLGLAAQADERRRGLEFAKAMTAEMERQAEEQRSLDDALNGFSGRTADALKRAQTARLEQRLAGGEAFSEEELGRIVKGIAGIKDDAEKTFDAAGRSAERFAENVQDALGETLARSVRGDFESIGQLWGNLLIKMASEALAADLGAKLFGDLLGGNKTGGNGLFGSLIGSFFSLGTGRASGGTIQPWSMQRVNESGFELLSAGGQDWLLAGASGGLVTPAGRGGGATHVTVIQHITGPSSGASRTETMAWRRLVQQEAYAAVRDAARRGDTSVGAGA